DGNYEEVAGWVAAILATDPAETYKEYTSGEWLTGEDVYNGIADGTVAGYYEFQQELMGTEKVPEPVPVENYVAFDIMTEAGESLYAAE
ncbi:MAG TPA: taurine ABC transporter substrate-binding protein, partial [Candidatus Scatomorpha stercoravium]|nr:taurine ABC transporter substrate-binding protein [Candidatus Scatomorpha stercoravium]